jgi:hypothetical protein
MHLGNGFSLKSFLGFLCSINEVFIIIQIVDSSMNKTMMQKILMSLKFIQNYFHFNVLNKAALNSAGFFILSNSAVFNTKKPELDVERIYG